MNTGQQGMTIKRAVRSTYDKSAADYASGHRMQTETLGNLAHRLLACHPQPARILDVGAGAGSTILDVVPGNVWNATGTPKGVSPLVVTDLSRDALVAARSRRSHAVLTVQADAEALPFADGRFGLVYANSVLHWVHIASGKAGFDRAVAEMLRVTQPGGCIGASISGVGTATKFLRAYRRVLDGLDHSGLGGGNRLQDPIGSMDLASVVTAFEVAGARIIEAALVYEPVLYEDPADYAADVVAYGYDVFLAPVDHGHRAAVWRAICEAFVDDVGLGSYLHDQYIIYVVAKPGQNSGSLKRGRTR